jgi:serpin B
MNRRRLLALTAALTAGGLAGCASDADGPGGGNDTPTDSDPGILGDSPTPTSGDSTNTDSGTDPGTPTQTIADPDIEDGTLAELVARTNTLAFDLYDQSTSGSDENVLASPVSVTTALAMTYAGARGETRTQMREALDYTLDDEALHDAFAALQRELNERGGEIDPEDLPSNYDPGDDPVPFQLSLVNALWGQSGFPFRDEYLSLVESHYGGGLREVDYEADPEAARTEINDWVADRTEERITDLLPEGSIKQRTRLVLTNAIYFLANWQHPFQTAATEEEAFTALDGSTTDVPMMSQEVSLPYAEVDGAKAIDLPYVGEDVSMLVVLPPEDEFEAYESSLDREGLAALVDALETREGTVALPRFEFDSTFALKDALEELGMPVAFDENRADFSGMAHLDRAGGNLYLSDVYHETYVTVDEEGTEAAAATGVVVDFESAPANPFEFAADRPFLFAIRDRPTGVVLFLGRVVDAGAAQ